MAIRSITSIKRGNLGLTDTLGEFLDGTGNGVPGVNATLLISPKARGITLVS